MWKRGLSVLVFITLPVAYGAQPSGHVRVADTGLGFNRDHGLSLSRWGEALVKKSSITVHDGHWKRVYWHSPSTATAVVIEAAGKDKTLRLADRPPADLLTAEYSATATASDTVRIDLELESKSDLPMSVEYCAFQMTTTPLVGCPFAAKKCAEVKTGTVPLVCAGPNSMLAHRVAQFTLESRLGTIRIRTEGDEPWLDVLDARKRSWADPQNPVLWIGALSQKLERGKKQLLRLTVEFSGRPAQPAAEVAANAQPKPLVAVADLIVPPSPVPSPLIPAPKEVKTGSGAMTILPSTPIVIGERAKPEDRRGAEELQRELEAAFGVKLAIQTSASVKTWQGAIVLGEPTLNPLSEVACRAAQVVVTPQAPGPEGYVLAASPSGIVVAGCDMRGTYWGVQTLLQLLRWKAGGGVEVPAAVVRDWPDFPMRAAHWSIHGKETGFQRRMIERVLARHKINTLFLECESIAWESHPELNPQAIKPAEVAKLVQFAREHFIEVIPQIQSLGHCEYWLLHKHPELAEVPEAPYNYCPSNPETYKILFDLYREAEAIFHPRYFHVGHDEVSFSALGVCPRCKGKPPADLFAEEVRKLRDFWAERRVPIMLWGDMLLAPMEGTGGNDCYNGGPPLKIADALDKLPKDVIICDWHYGDGYKEFPSLGHFKRHGFRTVATPWHLPGNIWNFTLSAKQGGCLGVIGSTWCDVDGPEAQPACLVRSFRYLYSLIYAADCMWSVGQRGPDAMGYSPAEQFLRAVNASSAIASKSSPGFLVDLSPFCTRSLSDKSDAGGWLDYGASRDLAAFPTGRVRLGGTEFLVAGGQRNAVMLWGTYAGKARLPREVKHIPIKQRASGLVFLHVCGWATDPAQKVGAYRVAYADGSVENIPLVQGGNIAETTCLLPPAWARTAWEGKMADGTQIKAFVYQWRNPHAEKEIISLDFVSAGTHAAPTLLGLSVVGL